MSIPHMFHSLIPSSDGEEKCEKREKMLEWYYRQKGDFMQEDTSDFGESQASPKYLRCLDLDESLDGAKFHAAY